MSQYWKGERPGAVRLSSFLAALAGAIIGGLIVGALLLTVVPRNNVAPETPGTLPTPSADMHRQSSELPSTGMYSVAWAAEKIGPSVVKIATKQEEVKYYFFSMPIVQEREGLGSGVIIDSAGYVLTNYHVIHDKTEIAVVLADGRQFPAKLVGGDEYTDIAVIRIEGSGLPVAELGNSDSLVVGEQAVAIGNPFGFDHTVTAGVISALNRSIERGDGSSALMEGLIQTDAPINPGNSGGALVSQDGKVIGINTAIYQEAQGIGFAVPINTAREVANDIIKYGKVKRPYHGVAEVVPLNRQVAWQYGLPVDHGLYVTKVAKGSPAAGAGIVPGDIIIAIDDSQVTSVDDVRRSVFKRSVGDKVRFTLVGSESRRQRDVVVVLEESPY